MKRFLSYILFCCLLLTEQVIAQPKAITQAIWEQIGTAQQIVNDAVLLPNGQLAIAGVATKSGKEQGLFLLMDAQTGEILLEKTFPCLLKDGGFNAIAEADDGSFYLVGYARTSKKAQKAWLIRIDEKGNKLWEQELGERGESAFEKIVWLADGTGLVAGYKNQLNNGTIWLARIKDGAIIQTKEIGEGAFKDITGLATVADGKIWLSGNTAKTKKVNRGNVWLMQMEEQLTILNHQIIGNSDWQQAQSFSANYAGDLLMGGYTNTGIDNDPWLTIYDATGQQIQEMVHSGIEESEISTVLSMPNGQSFLSLQTVIDNAAPKWKTHQFGQVTPDNSLDLQNLTLAEIARFRIKKALRTHQGTIVLVGNDLVTNTFRLICLPGSPTVAAKSLAKLNYENVAFYFEDTNADDCFSAEERGAIRFNLKNTGTTDISEGSIDLKVLQTVKGLSFPRAFQYLPYLSKQMTRTITIPVIGSKELQAGNTKVQLKVTIQDRPSLTIPLTIESIHCPKKTGSPIKIIWQKPDIIASRSIRTVEEEVAIELTIVAPRILKASDAKIYKRTVLIEDEKSQRRTMKHTNVSKEGYIHRFKYTITGLREGDNSVYVEIDGYQSDEMLIRYEPRKPKLHVLAIGPSYPDLKYPAKDAKDFVQTVKEQYDTNFFSSIIIEQLVDSNTTSTNAIQSAFERLKNRYTTPYEADYIATNDYVMVFLSGHGENRKERFYFLPSDYKENAKETTSVDYEDDILAFLNEIKCKKILFIDACLSGAAVGKKAGLDESIPKALIRANTSALGTAIFTSCSAKESSFEYPKGENGIFTEALLEAFNHQIVQLQNQETLYVDNGFSDRTKEANDGIITIGELCQFLSRRVPDLLQSIRTDYRQTPSWSLQDLKEDLPIFLFKK